jgi:predicted O-methyltransferase YrrM
VARNGGARDERRIVVAPSPLDPALGKVLEDPEVLRRFERHYVFVQVDPQDAPDALRQALGRSGPGGLVVLDAARSVNGFGEEQKGQPRTYPDVLAAAAGPLTKAAVIELLGRKPATKTAAR